MTVLKYSRQREVIKKYLAGTKEHPTADTVYLHVREEFPHISLGTVYRNLNLLVEMGEAVKITTPDGAVRFDGNAEPHHHVVCVACRRMFDLEIPPFDFLNEQAQEHFSGRILSHSVLFYGKCRDCMTASDSQPR